MRGGNISIDGYPATPLHCPRDRSLPVAGCYFSGSPCAALVSRLQSTSPTSRPEFRLGNREQWSPTGHVFPSNSYNNHTVLVKQCQCGTCNSDTRYPKLFDGNVTLMTF